jgi:hypothetical protein
MVQIKSTRSLIVFLALMSTTKIPATNLPFLPIDKNDTLQYLETKTAWDNFVTNETKYTYARLVMYGLRYASPDSLMCQFVRSDTTSTIFDTAHEVVFYIDSEFVKAKDLSYALPDTTVDVESISYDSQVVYTTWGGYIRSNNTNISTHCRIGKIPSGSDYLNCRSSSTTSNGSNGRAQYFIKGIGEIYYAETTASSTYHGSLGTMSSRNGLTRTLTSVNGLAFPWQEYVTEIDSQYASHVTPLKMSKNRYPNNFGLISYPQLDILGRRRRNPISKIAAPNLQ